MVPGTVRFFFDFPILLALSLLLVPFAAAPAQYAPRQESSGMDAPPPAVLESYRSLGGWSGLERRVLNVPPSYRLDVSGAWGYTSRLLQPLEPPFARTTLALLGQWRLEGG